MEASNNEMKEILVAIQKRLDVLISLTLQKELKQDNTLKMKDIISSLASFGLKYTEIASILGRTPSYISSELTQAKKKGKKNV